MQFEPEESGEERRRRQRDYHAFLDAQVDARKNQPAAAHDDVTDPAGWLPVLPLSARLKHQASAPYRAEPTTGLAKHTEKALVVNNGGVVERNLDYRTEIANREEHFKLLEQRLEAEVQRRHLVERKIADLGQKLEMWRADSTASISSLGARDAVVTEVREQTRNLETELAGMREWKNRVDASLVLAPKVQELTQQQVKALEEEARTRIQADEARSARFRQAVERVSSEVVSLAHRLDVDENDTRQRVEKIEAALTGEAKGAREATRQLGAQVQALGSDVCESESKMSSLLQSLRMLEKRQLEQQSAAAEAKSAREEAAQLREKVHALSASFSRSEKNMSSLLEALRALETRQQQQRVKGDGTTEEQVSRQQIQDSLMAATTVKLDLLRNSLADELSGLMGDTAKRAVESTNVPQLMTALRGRVELAEERLNNMADKSFRALEDELTGVRTEVKRLEDRIDTGPIAAGLRVLTANTETAQATAQSQLTELQDALSAEITARRRNAVRLAEAQAATKEGGRESAVQATSGLRARCLELEELVARLTRDIQTAQEDLSSQTQTQLAATQERNSRAVGKLEESLAGIRVQLAQQGAEEDRNCARVAARVDELEGLITGNKDLLREAEERARNAFGAIEAKFTDRMAGVESEETVRIEAIELALREQGHHLKEAIEADHRSNRRRSDEIHADVKSLEGRMRTIIGDAQEEESARVGSLLQQAQEQVNREITRVRQNTDRVATETNTLREKLNTVETSRMDSALDLHRELSTSTEASQSRMRLWAEDRMRKERAATQESLGRTQQQSEMVRALLDETVQAVSKEVEILRAESRARDVALGDSLDERASELEVKLTEIDNGAAKKRRVTELTKETGARIGGVERRVRQAEQELKKELEVKLAVSSLVCAVADNASTQRLEQNSSEVARLEAKREAGYMEREASLRAELGKTNTAVAGLQADIRAAKGWQKGVDNLELKLMARIAELKAIAEAAESSKATAKAENALALENAAKRNEVETDSEQKAEAADVSSTEQGPLAQKRSKKKAMNFAALNDELEAEDSPSPSPAPSSRLRGKSDANDDNNDARRQPASRMVDERRRPSSEVAGVEQGTKYGKQGTGGDERFISSGSDEGDRSGGERAVAEQSQENLSDKAPASPGATDVSRRGPSSPTSGASYTPPLSPGSDMTTAQSEPGGATTAGESKGDSESSASEGEGGDDESDDEHEESRSGHPSSAEVEVTSRRGDEDSVPPLSDAAGDTQGDGAVSDTGSSSSSEQNAGSGSEQETDDDDSAPGGEGDGETVQGAASAGGSGMDSERSDRASSRGEDDSSREDGGSRDGSGGSGSQPRGGQRPDDSGASDEANGETEGSVTPRGSDPPSDGDSRASDASDGETEGSIAPRGSDLPGDGDSGASDASDGETEGSVAPRGSDLTGDDDSGASDEASGETEGSVTPRGSELPGDDSGVSDESERETEGSVTPRGSSGSRRDAREEGDGGAPDESEGETEGSLTPRGSDRSIGGAGKSEEEGADESADESSRSSGSEASSPGSRGRSSTDEESSTARRKN